MYQQEIRNLDANQFKTDMRQGVDSLMQGHLDGITAPVGGTLLAAGLALVVVVFVAFRRGRRMLSPRLPN